MTGLSSVASRPGQGCFGLALGNEAPPRPSSSKGSFDPHASARVPIGSMEGQTLTFQPEVGVVRSIVLAMFVAVIWMALSAPQQA